MTVRRFALAGLFVTALSGAAFAQAAPVDQPMPMPASPLVQAFAQDAGISNQFEMTESQIALEKSSNPAIRAFARRMIHDHGMAEMMLTEDARPSGVVTHFMFPAPLQAKIDTLQGLSGAEFDQAYLADQQEGHASAAAKLADYAASGEDPALVAYARETLPVVHMHQRMLASITGQGPMAMN